MTDPGFAAPAPLWPAPAHVSGPDRLAIRLKITGKPSIASQEGPFAELSQTKALIPVMARPTMSVLISRVPS